MLAIVAALCLAAGLGLATLYLVRGATLPASWPKTILKTLSVAYLIPAALLLQAPHLIVAGLALGALGDFLLSRPSEQAFLGGMGAFAAGHLAYVLAFWAKAPGTPSILFSALFLLLALSTELWLAPRTGALRWPVRAYVIVISLMGIAAFSLPDHGLTKLGACAFILSDLLLALDLFVLPEGARIRRLIQRTLWTFYWSGQALILIGQLPVLPA